MIMCTYDRADLLPRAIDSLLAQHEADWELVVVDDASTDDTHRVVLQYAATDARIRLETRPANGGVAAARNTGIAAANGLFVTFLDSDDAYAPDHLSSRRQMLVENDDILFLHGGVTVIGDPWVIDKDDPTKKIHVQDCVVGGSFVIRYDALQRIGSFSEGTYADDAEFFERAANMGILIAKTDHSTYLYYRNTPNQLTSTHGS